MSGSIIGPGGLKLIRQFVQVETLAQFGATFLLFGLGVVSQLIHKSWLTCHMSLVRSHMSHDVMVLLPDCMSVFVLSQEFSYAKLRKVRSVALIGGTLQVPFACYVM